MAPRAGALEAAGEPLPGIDFEENLLHEEHAAVPRKEWDECARIKLGRSRPLRRSRGAGPASGRPGPTRSFST